MAYSTFVGSFNIDTTKTVGQDQVITGVGFQPKIVLFWWGGSTGTVDTVAGGSYNIGFGVAISSSKRYCFDGYSLDAGASSSAGRVGRNDSCITAYTDISTIDGLADFKSLDADGFTLTIDDQFTQAYRISYLALGGTDLTNVNANTFTSAAVTGNYSIAGIGFQPDALILINFGRTAYNAISTPLRYWSLGWAVSSTAQGVINSYVAAASATSNTFGSGNSHEIFCGLNISPVIRASFVSFDADGFTLNHLEGTAVQYVAYIAFKGGNYAIGDITTRTDGNDITETLGFLPPAILFGHKSYLLQTNTGAFSVSGQNAMLLAGRKVLAATGTFTETGSDAYLLRAAIILADSGAFALTGNEARLLAGQKILANTGSFMMTGSEAYLLAWRKLLADTGAFALTGSEAKLLRGSKILASTGVFVLTGSDAYLLRALIIMAASGVFALTGSDAMLLTGQKILANAGSFMMGIEYGINIGMEDVEDV